MAFRILIVLAVAGVVQAEDYNRADPNLYRKDGVMNMDAREYLEKLKVSGGALTKPKGTIQIPNKKPQEVKPEVSQEASE